MRIYSVSPFSMALLFAVNAGFAATIAGLFWPLDIPAFAVAFVVMVFDLYQAVKFVMIYSAGVKVIQFDVEKRR